jgi:hypothetical protein
MDKKNYTIKTKLHSHNPKVVEKLIGGSGVLDMINDVMSNMAKAPSMETPFHLLNNSDFDHADPIVDKFMNMGGPKHVIKIFKIDSPDDISEAMHHLASTLQETRLALVRKELRNIFASLQSALDIDNKAVKLERTASKMQISSRGFHQGESLCGVESLLKIANKKEMDALVDVEKMISAGGYIFLSRAAEIVKNMYESYSTPRNTRVAYTTLATQEGEPFLMCPKGIYVNGQAVPMETSKCRHNCIDSRLEKDGSVSCNYQTWIKQSFQSHDVVMGRLDTTRHPDNEANLLNIEEGKRMRHEDEVGYERLFEESDLESAKLRKKNVNQTDNREKQLSEMKAVQYGHSVDDKKLNQHVKLSQTNHNKVIEDQLPNRAEVKKSLFDRLVDKYNNKTSSTEVIETNLEENAGLYDQKGDPEDSTTHMVNDMKEKSVHVIKEINDNAGDGSEESISHTLNKTAKKNDDMKSFDSHLEEKRTNEDIDKNIETLLGEDADWGHQFADEDLKHFASELGLDYILEQSRED